MGAWGPAIFSDDVACDVRDTYRELLEDQVPDADAAQRTLERFSDELDDVQDRPTVWIALALTQSRYGRLSADVRDAALAAIDGEAVLDPWRDEPKQLAKRKAALAKARIQLEGPQPERRRIPKPRRRDSTLRPGDVVGCPSSGGWLLARVVRLDDDRGGTRPVLVRLSGTYTGHDDELAALVDDFAPWHVPPASPEGQRGGPFWVDGSAHDMANAGFEVLGNVGGRTGDDDVVIRSYLSWSSLKHLLERP